MPANGGTHHNWGGIAVSTAGGAASGAAIGSAVPGVGTAIGAGAGALTGFFSGLFGGDQPDAAATPPAPPPPPDLTDEIVARAQMAKQKRELSSGLPDTFLTGPVGAVAASGSTPKLGSV